MTINVQAIRKIRELGAERDRLLQILEFYGWLEKHGTSWDQVKGIRPLDNTGTTRLKFKHSCRNNGMIDVWERYNFADMVRIRLPTKGYVWVKYDPEIHFDYAADKVERKPNAYQGKFIDIQLNDGRRLVLPWPPFPESVIYNR